MLSVVGKFYGCILIEYINRNIDRAVGDKQCGFREGSRCVHKIFTILQKCEKHL